MASSEATRRIAVIDGNSLMHRAFHAIQPNMTAPDGTHTNALFGFFSMLAKFCETFTPDGLIVAFDKGKPQVRIDMLPQYKAQRPPMDPSLHEQFPLVKDLLRAMDVPVCELAGWEGDDILGTLARRGEAAGYDMYLVTGDRDMYQLSTEHVKIVSTKHGTSDVAIMTPESVNDLYNGITPELVPDFYGLKGDSSDNIPGVPGIGPKKAAALIGQYGSLDEVIAHADEVKGKMGENLRAHIDDALLSRKVATILTNAPIEIDFSDARWPTFDAQKVSDAFGKLGFTGLVARILKLGGLEPVAMSSQASAIELDAPCEDAERIAKAIDKAIAQGSWIGVGYESQARQAQLSLDLDDTPSLVVWISTDEVLGRVEGAAARELLVRLQRDALIASMDVKALLGQVYPQDSSQAAAIDADALDAARLFDCGVAGYLLDSDASEYEAAKLAEKYLKQSLPAPDDTYPAVAIDAVAARMLVEPMRAALVAAGAEKLFDEIEMPLVGVLLAMERRGLNVDPAQLRTQSAELGSEIDAMVASLHEEAGENFNVDSPMQLSHVLFDVWQLPTYGLKKTKRGYYSTNAKVLADLAAVDERVARVLDYRERAKIKSTYLDALPQLIEADGRIHTTFNQTVAATGRLSSSDPNLQNIPTRSELGHRVRTAFVAPVGTVFLACDYSQIELRLLAHLSGDEHLIAAFRSGEDFHAQTAARVFGVVPAEVTHEMRSRAKAVNFGIVYGQQAYGLATSLKIGRAEAQEMIDRYFEAYPGVKAYLDGLVAFARKHGYTETLFGRRRYTPEIGAKNFQMRSFAERTAMNHPMQGTAADIIKLAMIEVERKLASSSLQSKLILQIHDELDLEVPEAEIDEVSALVESTMEGVVELSVPLTAEVSYGANWAEAK